MTSSHGDISAWLAFCAGNSSVTGEFSPQRPVTRSFDVFVDAPGINGWVSNRVAGELRRHRPHYDVIVMWKHRPVCLCHTQLYRDDSHHHVLISYIAFWTHKIPVISHPKVSVVFRYRNLIVFSRRVLKYRILILGWQFSVRSRYDPPTVLPHYCLYKLMHPLMYLISHMRSWDIYTLNIVIRILFVIWSIYKCILNAGLLLTHQTGDVNNK